MALLIRKDMRDVMKICPICQCQVSNTRHVKHIAKCKTRYKHQFDEKQLAQCPYNPLHIMNKEFLDFHIEHHCDEVKNNVLRILQEPEKYGEVLSVGDTVSMLHQLMSSNSLESNMKYITDRLYQDGNKLESSAAPSASDSKTTESTLSNDVATTSAQPINVKIETEEEMQISGDNISDTMQSETVGDHKPELAKTLEIKQAAASSDPRLKRGASYGTIPFTKIRRIGS